jgi:hypothetical protein
MKQRIVRLTFACLPVALTSLMLVAPISLSGQEDPSVFSYIDTGGRSISLGEQIEGELSRTDPLSGMGKRVQAWTLHGAPGEALLIDLESTDFDSFLYVVGPELGDGLRDDDGGLGLNSRLCIVPQAASGYRVIVASLGLTTGSFSLSVHSGQEAVDNGTCSSDGAANGIQDLTMLDSEGVVSGDLSVIGTMRGDEPLYQGHPLQAWEFQGETGESMVIELRSTSMDSYLLLGGPGFSELAQNDDGGGGTDSRLCVVLPETGTYRIYAGAFVAADPGSGYRLSIRPADGAEPCDTTVVSPEQRRTAMLDLPTSGRVLRVGDAIEAEITEADPLDPETGGFIQPWDLESPGHGWVMIDLISPDFDAFLEAIGEGGDQESDDFGTGCNSRIVIPGKLEVRLFARPLLPPEIGAYTLKAEVFDSEEEAWSQPMIGGGCGEGGEDMDPGMRDGDPASPTTFTVDASLLDGVTTSPARAMKIGTEYDGILDATETTTEGLPAQGWTMDLEQGVTYVVALDSDEFDAFLYLMGPGLVRPLADDDSGGNLGGRILFMAPESGQYTAVVSTLIEGGGFQIRAFRRQAR